MNWWLLAALIVPVGIALVGGIAWWAARGDFYDEQEPR